MQLEVVQQAMAAAIDRGPDFVPEGLFAGSRDRVLRGFAVHANTISHARLVALEDTFPRCREAMGETAFNRLSRSFIESGEARCEPLASIGRTFAGFIAGEDAKPEHAELARFEWLWLECFHAAEARLLGMGDLAGLDEARMLALVIVRHPAARLALHDGEDVLLVRPHEDVRSVAASEAMLRLFASLKSAQPIAALIADAGDPARVDEQALPALIALIEAGALSLADGVAP